MVGLGINTNDLSSFQPMNTGVMNNSMLPMQHNPDTATVSDSSIVNNTNMASSISSSSQPSVLPSNTTSTQLPSTANVCASHTQNPNQQSASQPPRSTTSQPTHVNTDQILTKTRLQDLVKEIDPCEQLDEEVEDLLLQLVDDFVNSTVNTACVFAKHRNANTVEVKDVQLYLQKMYHLWIPGFGTEDIKPYKKPPTTEAHKQRLALIRKSLRKY